MFTRIKLALLALMLGVLCVSLGIMLWTRNETEERITNPSGVLREVQQLNELVSVRYSVQKVVGLKENKIPFGTESILLVVQGNVLAGVDLKELKQPDIRIERKKIFMKLPPARILHVYLDEKNTQVWDRKITWWTPWVPYNPDFERKARLAAIDSIRGQAEEMGILRDARRNTEHAIRVLLSASGMLEVTFVPT